MSNVWVIRNVDSKTKKFIYDYAHQHNLTIAKALHDLVFLAKQHLNICLKYNTK